jgi:hypothetical protein
MSMGTNSTQAWAILFFIAADGACADVSTYDCDHIFGDATMKWNLLLASCLFVAVILLLAGVPLFPVILGIALAVVWSWLKRIKELHAPENEAKSQKS